MPTTRPVDSEAELDPDKFAATFSHKDEFASPGYYSVQMGDIKAELTASKHVGMHRYTFPKSTDSKVIIDLTHGLMDHPTELNFKVIDDHTIAGLRRSSGWANDQYECFVAKFNKPIRGYGISKDHEAPVADATAASGNQLSAYLNFDTTDGQPVVAEVALSNVSTDAALKNLQAEAPANFDFDRMHEQARDAWRSELDKVNISTNDEHKARTFYTSLYHSMLAPTLVSDVDGGYRGSDNKIHKAEGFENYSTFSLWDTYRAEHPLLTIVEPNKVNDLVKSLYVHGEYAPNKQLPVWTLDSNETNCMIGYHSFPVIAEAYAKGFRGFDAEGLYKLMVQNSKRNDWWADKGYMPSDKEGESVSKTLEFAYDDYCLSQFAKALGHNDDAAKYAKRSQEWRNVYDKESGFMRGRNSDGSWDTPFDATKVGGGGRVRDFTEANPWQYSFSVPQDVHSMIDLYGGNEKFVDKLDKLFTTQSTEPPDTIDVSGMIGQYAQGNEPSHHIAYLYSYAGAPEKTAQHIKEIRDKMYNDKPDGLCGNEDCGQMSAWYVFSSLGFYPVNPVSGEYVIGTPEFDKASIDVPGGKKFQVVAPNLSDKNIYIQNATLNGKPLDHCYITHEDIMSGGTLVLNMTDKPGDWGHGKDAAPQN
jgi:predicted alpha-1,2-mannosidase